METPNQPLDPAQELLHKLISGWVRQSRYRAKKIGIETDLSYQDIIEVYKAEEYKCVYCGQKADSPDHPFPIKDKGPCIQANVVPCCDPCRTKKHNRNLVKYYQDGGITEEKLHAIVKSLLKRKGGQQLKEYIKSIYVPSGTPDKPTA